MKSVKIKVILHFMLVKDQDGGIKPKHLRLRAFDSRRV